MSQENLEAVRDAISAFNERDVDRYLAHCTEDIQLHSPLSAVEGVYEGADAIRRYFSDLDDTIPDFRLTIERLQPIGADRVLALLHFSATGRTSGISAVLSTATGDALPVASIYDVADGKISRIRIFLDRAEALEAAELLE